MIKILATIFGITGSSLVASNMGFQAQGFVCFFICSAYYAYTNIKMRDMPAAYLWTFYTMMDAFGCYRYL